MSGTIYLHTMSKVHLSLPLYFKMPPKTDSFMSVANIIATHTLNDKIFKGKNFRGLLNLSSKYVKISFVVVSIRTYAALQFSNSTIEI